ncbi:MFS transporter [Pectobacterium aroidearum]|uniref:MFS transporter n=1 Tax=Pectobacterium aroidearum TaxID=1201031 RepID=UPI0033073AA9
MNKRYITVASLIIGQGLTGSIISLLTLTSTLVGNSLSPSPYLATLPITATVVGSAIMVYYASHLMNVYGRRTAFSIGSGIGILGSIFAAISVYYQIFSFFVFSTFIMGCATVFNQYYRFAGAEVFDDESSKKKCTSLIIGGGVIGGVIGPFIATKGAYLISSHLFLGTFFIAIVIFVFALGSQIFISLPKPVVIDAKIKKNHPEKEIKSILSSHYFILGTLSCALGFSIMTLVMNATPLAMHHEHYQIQESAFVLQWHFLAMYAPALFLPLIISKIKTKYIIQCGAILFLIGSLSSLYFDDFTGYIITLVAVGIGWSFMFTGGTFLINQISDKEIKHKIQGINSLITYMLNLVASLAVGFFMNIPQGWLIINSMTIAVMFCFLVYMLKNMTRYD